MAGWPLISEVEDNESRFASAAPRDDVPSLAAAKKHDTKLDPESHPRMSAERLWAVSMNSKLNSYRAKQAYTCKNGLPAVALVMTPKKPTDALHIFLVTDKVYSTLHLVCCYKVQDGEGLYELRTPFRFLKSHDLFTRLYKAVSKDRTTIEVYELLVHVCEESWLSSSALPHAAWTILVLIHIDTATYCHGPIMIIEDSKTINGPTGPHAHFEVGKEENEVLLLEKRVKQRAQSYKNKGTGLVIGLVFSVLSNFLTLTLLC